MAAPTKPWTRAELARLPDDGNRYEVLNGALLVTPQPSFAHQRVATLLLTRLESYGKATGMASVVGPGAIPFGENELQPDIQVIPGRQPGGNWADLPTPLLIVEVLSASTARRDRGAKLEAYQRGLRVPTVWLVDGARREILVFAGSPEVVVAADRLVWRIPGAELSFELDLREFFHEVLGPPAKA